MKTAIKIVVGLAGGVLVLMFMILAVHDKSLIFAIKALVSFLVTATIIKSINKSSINNPHQGSSAFTANKLQRQLAIGLAIGFLGSIVLFKIIIWWLEHQ